MINLSTKCRALYALTRFRYALRSQGKVLGMMILMGTASLLCTGCGWILEDPPAYPDQGVGGEEMGNEIDESEMGDGLSESEQEIFMMRSSRGE